MKVKYGLSKLDRPALRRLNRGMVRIPPPSLDFLIAPERTHAPLTAAEAFFRNVERRDQVVREDGARGRVAVTCGGYGLRWEVTPRFGVGFIEEIDLGDGAHMRLIDIVPRAHFVIHMVSDGVVNFGFCLDFSTELWRNTAMPTLQAPFAYASLHPVGYRHDVSFPSERPMRLVLLGCRQGRTDPILDFALEDLPASLRAMLDSGATERAAVFAPAPAAAMGGLRDIFVCPYHGRVRHQFMRAKAREIICHVTSALSGAERNASEARRVTYLDMQRVEEARRILQAEWREPPSLSALAIRVNLSRSKLINGFRACVGTTAYAYVRDLRMGEAERLLVNTDLSIQEVAEKVGFTDASNFAKCYRSQFGRSPRQAR